MTEQNLSTFHGIDFIHLDSILQKGLIPQFTSSWTDVKGEKLKNQNFIFLGTDIDTALSYCNNTYDEHPHVVLEILTNSKNLYPDDIDCPNAKSWEESKNEIQQVKHLGEITVDQIINLHFFNQGEGNLVLSSKTNEDWKSRIEELSELFEW